MTAFLGDGDILFVKEYLAVIGIADVEDKLRIVNTLAMDHAFILGKRAYGVDRIFKCVRNYDGKCGGINRQLLWKIHIRCNLDSFGFSNLEVGGKDGVKHRI